MRLHRRRALDGSDLRGRDRRRRRRAARLAARLRRAGARDLRAARALGRVDIVCIDSVAALVPKAELEGEMGDSLRRPPGAADEPGAAQARGLAQPQRHRVRLHQPAAREDRRDVRLSRDHAGRPRAQVLRLRAPRHPAHRDAQGRRGGLRQPRARQGRQEQGRAAVPAGRVRRHLRARHLLGGHGARRRPGEGGRAEERLVPLVRRGAHRPGPREGQGVPAGASGRAPAHAEPHPGGLGGLDHPGRHGAAAGPRAGRGRRGGAAGGGAAGRARGSGQRRSRRGRRRRRRRRPGA